MPRARDQDVIDAFSTVLRELRLSHGLVQEELAFTVGLDRTYIVMLENGKRQPSLSVIWAIAQALGHRPQELVARVEEVVRSRTTGSEEP